MTTASTATAGILFGLRELASLAETSTDLQIMTSIRDLSGAMAELCTDDARPEIFGVSALLSMCVCNMDYRWDESLEMVLPDQAQPLQKAAALLSQSETALSA